MRRALLVVLLTLVACGRRSVPEPTGPLISHKTVERWLIPNGGEGRAMVVDPRHRNEADMRALGQQLRYMTKNSRQAVIFIYDDERAARMRQAAISEQLNAADLSFFDDHQIGHYFWNANTGFDGLTMTLDGTMGSAQEVRYGPP